MIAVDANILLRALLEDDPVQTPIAQRALKEELAIFVPMTVVLEVEWVLRSRAKYSNSAIVDVLTALFGQPNVTVQNVEAVTAALVWTKAGMSIPDAMHLANSAHCSGLLSFDGDFKRAAERLGGVPVRQP